MWQVDSTGPVLGLSPGIQGYNMLVGERGEPSLPLTSCRILASPFLGPRLPSCEMQGRVRTFTLCRSPSVLDVWSCLAHSDLAALAVLEKASAWAEPPCHSPSFPPEMFDWRGGVQWVSSPAPGRGCWPLGRRSSGYGRCMDGVGEGWGGQRCLKL